MNLNEQYSNWQQKTRKKTKIGSIDSMETTTKSFILLI